MSQEAREKDLVLIKDFFVLKGQCSFGKLCKFLTSFARFDSALQKTIILLLKKLILLHRFFHLFIIAVTVRVNVVVIVKFEDAIILFIKGIAINFIVLLFPLLIIAIIIIIIICHNKFISLTIIAKN